MRAWILSTALAAAALGFAPSASLAAPTPTPTQAKAAAASATPAPAKPNPSPTPAPPTATPVPPTPTPVPATATPLPHPTAAASAGAPAAPSNHVATAPSSPAPAKPTAAPTTAVAAATAAPTVAATAQATPSGTPNGKPTPAGPGTLHGFVFGDANADGQVSDGESGIGQYTVTLTAPSGAQRTVQTDDTGAFGFDGLPFGTYRLQIDVPPDMVPTTDAGQDVEITAGDPPSDVLFGLISAQAAGLTGDQASQPDPADEADDEQVIALSSVTSLPLRFAEGRDLMNQVQRRVLGDGLIWLGVPFRSQIDGGDFQYVNCGPASLTMVLAGFGLEVGPSQVRDYLNNLIDNFDTDLGTSLDVLDRIAQQAGLTPMDLYSDQGGYRNWSTDAVRWHIQQGHPVITLVKYRNLPGHTSSHSTFDHYIVITGLTPNGFIYNDAAFATTLGYGLEISDVELEYAWNNSSIPHYAVALGLDPDKKALSFPELPRTRRSAVAGVRPDAAPAAARSSLRQAQADEAPRAPLLLTPTPPMPVPSGPLIGVSDRWQDDADVPPPDDPGTPMGLDLQATNTPALEARPGPGAEVPKLLLLVGSPWLVWTIWSASGLLVRLAGLLRLRGR